MNTTDKTFCIYCKLNISSPNFSNHLKTKTHLRKAMPLVIITSPENESIIYNFQKDTIINANRTCFHCNIPFYHPEVLPFNRYICQKCTKSRKTYPLPTQEMKKN